MINIIIIKIIAINKIINMIIAFVNMIKLNKNEEIYKNISWSGIVGHSVLLPYLIMKTVKSILALIIWI